VDKNDIKPQTMGDPIYLTLAIFGRVAQSASGL
jgi:hypothetical protein